MTGSLAGIRIIEFASIGPGPFCGMMPGDHGAEAIQIECPDGEFDRTPPVKTAGMSALTILR